MLLARKSTGEKIFFLNIPAKIAKIGFLFKIFQSPFKAPQMIMNISLGMLENTFWWFYTHVKVFFWTYKMDLGENIHFSNFGKKKTMGWILILCKTIKTCFNAQIQKWKKPDTLNPAWSKAMYTLILTGTDKKVNVWHLMKDILYICYIRKEKGIKRGLRQDQILFEGLLFQDNEMW